MTKVVLDFDDFSLMNNRFDLLLKLREHYPKLKVSMFMIPFHADYELSGSAIFKEQALKVLKENLDWIQIIPHGLTHVDREFEKADKEAMRLSMKAIDDYWKLQGIPYEKGFKAPQWLWNQDVVDVLDEEGWFGAVDRDQPNMLKTKKFYRFNFNAHEGFFLTNKEVMKIHAHINSIMTNDFERNFLHYMKIPPDAEFCFVTDFLEDRDG